MQFFQCVFWNLAGAELAASDPHLMGSKPDTKVSKVDESYAVRPPYKTELLGREKNEAPYWLFAFSFKDLVMFIWPHWCGGGRRSDVRFPVRAALIVGQ